MKNTISKLVPCDTCGNGIGSFTYKSGAIEGEYCSMDCYSDGMIKQMGWIIKLEPEEALNA